MIDNEINIIIGSWGSYNACNERALGSKWLNLSDYTDWEQIEEELTKQGFKLKSIDEELFIQGIEGLSSSGTNWDYIHPKNLFESLYESGVLNDDYKYELLQAFLDVRSLDDFFDLVNSNGSNWDDDIHLYKNYDWEDFGRGYFENCCYEIDNSLLDFFDFEAYGQYIGSEYAEEYSNGIIEIIR